jgi:menaquinone-dependent protoporphyrinogen oxidase
MKKILVTYATLSGSTAEVALAVGNELIQEGLEVDILPLSKVANLPQYDAVVVGAPMIMGWHLSALRFLVKNRRAFQHIPLAIYAAGMSLTWTGDAEVNGVPVCVDPSVAKPPADIKKPTLKERYSNIRHYAGPILKAARPARPVSLAFFGGSLELGRLSLPAKLFVVLVVQAQPGDRRNWPAIRSWAQGLPLLFNSN